MHEQIIVYHGQQELALHALHSDRANISSILSQICKAYTYL